MRSSTATIAFTGLAVVGALEALFIPGPVAPCEERVDTKTVCTEPAVFEACLIGAEFGKTIGCMHTETPDAPPDEIVTAWHTACNGEKKQRRLRACAAGYSQAVDAVLGDGFTAAARAAIAAANQDRVTAAMWAARQAVGGSPLLRWDANNSVLLSTSEDGQLLRVRFHSLPAGFGCVSAIPSATAQGRDSVAIGSRVERGAAVQRIGNRHLEAFLRRGDLIADISSGGGGGLPAGARSGPAGSAAGAPSISGLPPRMVMARLHELPPPVDVLFVRPYDVTAAAAAAAAAAGEAGEAGEAGGAGEAGEAGGAGEGSPPPVHSAPPGGTAPRGEALVHFVLPTVGRASLRAALLSLARQVTGDRCSVVCQIESQPTHPLPARPVPAVRCPVPTAHPRPPEQQAWESSFN